MRMGLVSLVVLLLVLGSGCAGGEKSGMSGEGVGEDAAAGVGAGVGAGVSGVVDSVEVIRGEVWKTVRGINRHWAVTEDMDSLALLLHPDMVMVSPDSKEPIRGRKQIVESYRGYARYAQTVSLVEREPSVQLYHNNKTAVVTYLYDLVIKVPSGETQQYSGRDMYTLIFEGGRWVAVAQHYSSLP